MCLDVLGMHGEVEEVWSGGSACWFDRSLAPVLQPPSLGLLRLCTDAARRALTYEEAAESSVALVDLVDVVVALQVGPARSRGSL